MKETTKQIGSFVREFFVFLETQRVRAVVLHGGENGFDHKLSDVDFAVGTGDFPSLPQLIHDYCSQAGWRLCQILRHETTAAYFVCSAADDPACAVALDACSDYQRNGTIFLTAEELLGDILPLQGGGYRPLDAVVLKYRFAKAAAKNKDVKMCALEFGEHAEDSRLQCTAWLMSRWGIDLESWDAVGLSPALRALRAKSRRRPSLLQPGSLHRIISRIMHPTGLLVVMDVRHFTSEAEKLEKIFGHLYFRSCRREPAAGLPIIRHMISSTLVQGTRLPRWARLLFHSSVIVLDPGEPELAPERISAFLHQRCSLRHGTS